MANIQVFSKKVVFGNISLVEEEAKFNRTVNVPLLYVKIQPCTGKFN